jgi:hypothetical protein
MPNENFIWPLFLSRGNGRPYFLHSVHISKPRKNILPYRISISPRRLLLYSIFRHYVFLDLFPRSQVYISRGMIIWQIRRFDASVHSIFISPAGFTCARKYYAESLRPVLAIYIRDTRDMIRACNAFGDNSAGILAVTSVITV